MNDGKKRNSFIIAVLLLLLIGLTVGYAVLSQTLTINGTTHIEKATWDIHFDTISITDGSVTGTNVTTAADVTDSTRTEIRYEISLPKPGDFYEFTAVVKNFGNLDAELSEDPVLDGISAEQDVYVNYVVSYADGSQIKAGDKLAAGASKTVKVRVEYDKAGINTNADLPKTNQNLVLDFDLNYIQS